MTTPRIPGRDTAPYKAAQYLYEEGPKSERDLLQAVDFGVSYKERDNLQRAIRSGWLVTTPDGRIVCSDVALDHFDTRPTVEKYIGTPAGPRIIDVMNRPPYKPAKPLRRADALDCSVRAIPSFYGKDQT
jgi:hypothetical protein